jgi:glutathione synthase/RimK-type ligase-like ATP-grasp enzyme
VGVDLVIDVERGPLMLEVNARPGLQIQVINGEGLAPALAEAAR